MRQETISQQREAYDLRKEMALQLASEFCGSHGYSSKRLQAQRYCELPGCVCFAQPSGVKPNGLMNDKETMPLPTLIIKLVDGKLVFETTEHSDKYLKD